MLNQCSVHHRYAMRDDMSVNNEEDVLTLLSAKRLQILRNPNNDLYRITVGHIK